MKILALDIGTGTEDVLLYDSQKQLENCIKMVLPSPSKVIAGIVMDATRRRQDLLVQGDTIGGGPLAQAFKGHLEAGLDVTMTRQAAYTLRNDLDEIESWGIQIVNEATLKARQGETIALKEVNTDALQGFLSALGEGLTDIETMAIAVQDHGRSPKDLSDRQFRIQQMKKRLERSARPEVFAFWESEIPPPFLRMQSAARASRRQLPDIPVLLMDTSLDAILGCLQDPSAERADPILVVNVGNGHTIAALHSSGEITAIMEHHTQLLSPQKMKTLLIRFANGQLSNDQIFRESGHGLFYLKETPGFSKIEMMLVTGPRRDILAGTDLSVHYAAPAGDMMMTGPIGLVEATKRRLQET